MLIGELSKKTQLSRDTIRFYEKKGLITAGKSISKYNNYKNYTDENLQQLMLIKRGKKFGFTLNEMAEILDLTKNDQASCSILREKIITKIDDIDKKIKALEEMKSTILLQLKDDAGNCQNNYDRKNCREVQKYTVADY